MAPFSYLLAALTLSLTAVAASAQTEWPAKPVRIVVGFAPGGTTDISARILAERLTRAFNETSLSKTGPVRAG